MILYSTPCWSLVCFAHVSNLACHAKHACQICCFSMAHEKRAARRHADRARELFYAEAMSECVELICMTKCGHRQAKHLKLRAHMLEKASVDRLMKRNLACRGGARKQARLMPLCTWRPRPMRRSAPLVGWTTADVQN